MISSLPESIVAVLKSCLPDNIEKIALHEPCFCGNEWDYVKQCIDTGWVSTAGEFVQRFEGMLVDFTGAKYAVAATNGTAALHIALKLAGVRPGDEVLLPTLTFVATANAVSYCGAMPHFVDSEEKTLGIDPQKLADYLQEITEVRDATCFNRVTNRPIRAIIPVHTFGHPVDLDPILETCERFKIVMVEDAAESLGSYYKGRHTGQFGLVSALSFNGNKIITTGGGGAILTNDESVAKHAKHITTTARLPHKWGFYHDEIGYNYRLPSFNAALGCAQMEQLADFVSKKRMLADRYCSAFEDLAGVRFFTEPAHSKSNYWLNVLLLDKEEACQRDAALELSNNSGIMVRPAWEVMHQLPMYKDCPRMNLSVAESIEERLINIPSSAFL